MSEETPWTGFCCLYNRPWLTLKPWTCGTCGMLHAVQCKPEPSKHPAPAREMWLAAELADLNREIVGNDYHADWRRFIEERYLEVCSEAA